MNRIERLRIFCLLAMFVVILRLTHLQVLRGSHYRQLAEQNRLRVVPEQAPRGLIVDRRGRLLAANQTIFRVAVVPQELDNLAAVLTRVSSIVGTPADVLNREFKKSQGLSFIPATIASRVSKDVALRLEEERWRLPGLMIRPETIRRYPLGMSTAHLLGYLSKPTADEMPELKQYGVRADHLVGRMGLERRLDEVLRGRAGGLTVEVNHRGRQVRVIGRRTPAAGSRVELTIDAPLQTLIEQALDAQPGACVVLDPETGEVLAMVSAPAFSPEAFALPEADAVRRFLSDPQASMMNRAAVGVYQPGSIMKLVAAAAALEAKLITPQTTIVCSGSITIGDRVFHCWNKDGHGPITLTEALMQSCNVYFMHVGIKLGAAHLRSALEAIGFSRKRGWLLEEQPGHLPQRRLSTGDVAQLAIGQGEILVTVLQAAVMASAFANHGWLVEPWVVRSIAERPVAHPMGRRRIGWSTQTIDAVRLGMQEVVRNPSGTGHRAYTPLVGIAGKTGTAQTHVLGKPHGWFVGFCPIEHPRVAMAIVAEHGGSGGDLPAEIARSICEYVSAPETL
jgi:penicillin-binding protein 2